MKLYLLSLILLIQQASLADEADPVGIRVESARQKFFAAVNDAREEVVVILDKKLNAAKRAGVIAPVEALTKEKQNFTEQGVTPSSVNTRTFRRRISIAVRSLKKEFETGIKSYVQEGKLEDAKRLREELKSFEESPLIRSSWGVAKYTVVSGAGTFVPFADRVKAFPNRNYVWGDVSPAWPLKQFAPVSGGGRDPIQITVKSPGWVFIAIGNEEPERVSVYLKQFSWQSTPYAFSYSVRGKTPMHIYRKQISKGDHVLPRVNFAGPVLLAP